MATPGNSEVERPLGDDEVRVWAEHGGPIMLKAVSSSSDPVELNEFEARRVAETLVRLANRIAGE